MSFRTEQRSIIPSINLATLANARISARIPHTVKRSRDPTTTATHDRSFSVNSRESNKIFPSAKKSVLNFEEKKNPF